MKLIHKNIRQGEIKLQIQSLDDLWYLSHIIEQGDIIKGDTTRKVSYGDSGEKAKTEKKHVFLSIKSEKTDFSDKMVLRVSGKIIEGPEEIGKGDYHSFEIEEGTIITIIKSKWLNYQLGWIDEASKDKSSKILICVMDRDRASFALMKKYGYEMLPELRGDVQKKEDRSKHEGDFYNEIIGQIRIYDSRYSAEHIVIASPAFFKDDLIKSWKNNELKAKIVLSGCSSTGENGINEVLKRTELAKILEDDKASKEMKLVEEILQEISMQGYVAYGLQESKNAIHSGAAKKLILTDIFIQTQREKGNFEEIDKMIKSAEDMKSEIHIISSQHEGGKKLEGLGGIATILRYKMNYT